MSPLGGALPLKILFNAQSFTEAYMHDINWLKRVHENICAVKTGFVIRLEKEALQQVCLEKSDLL